jgi:hypothetical protein
MRGAHLAQQVDARAARHADIGEQHVGCVIAQGRQRGFGGIEGARHHAAGAQRELEHPADLSVVFHEPDT